MTMFIRYLGVSNLAKSSFGLFDLSELMAFLTSRIATSQD